MFNTPRKLKIKIFLKLLDFVLGVRWDVGWAAGGLTLGPGPSFLQQPLQELARDRTGGAWLRLFMFWSRHGSGWWSAGGPVWFGALGSGRGGHSRSACCVEDLDAVQESKCALPGPDVPRVGVGVRGHGLPEAVQAGF